MELKAFSIKDTKAGALNPPYFAPSLGEGERQFIKLARDPQSNINQFPEDFDLYLVGSYDTDNGHMSSIDIPQQLFKGINALQKEQ